MKESLVKYPIGIQGLEYRDVNSLRERAEGHFCDSWERLIWQTIASWIDEDEDCMYIQSSGSTGEPKRIAHRKEYMINSAKATMNALHISNRSVFYLALSPLHIGGMMMIVRTLISGGQLFYAEPSVHPSAHKPEYIDLLALSPNQAYHLLIESADMRDDYFAGIKHVIIGGGAVKPALIQAMQRMKTSFYETFGMTETISHIALKKLNGEKGPESCFTVTGNTRVHCNDQSCLIVDAPDLGIKDLLTQDEINLIDEQQFEWLGRKGNVINSGGIKIHAEVLERLISAHLKLPFFIHREADEKLGERVIILIENNGQAEAEINLLLNRIDLPKFWKPRQIYFLTAFLYTNNGKLKRAETYNLLRSF